MIRRVFATLASTGAVLGLLVHVLDCLGLKRDLSSLQHAIVWTMLAVTFVPAVVSTYIRALDVPLRRAYSYAAQGWKAHWVLIMFAGFADFAFWLTLVIVDSFRNVRSGPAQYLVTCMESAAPLSMFLLAVATFTRRPHRSQ